jgi:hypothetical protein
MSRLREIYKKIIPYKSREYICEEEKRFFKKESS